MKKIVLRYGAYAALFELIIFILIWLVIWLLNPSHTIQAYVGWVNLLCPLLFIYFGIRYYRDRVNDGYITFIQGLKIGLLIVILPTVSFALIETVYVLYIDPKFYENVAIYDIEQYRKVLPPAEFAVKLKEIKQQIEAEKNPFYNFAGMILTVGSLGIIVTVISAVLLKKKAKQVIV